MELEYVKIAIMLVQITLTLVKLILDYHKK